MSETETQTPEIAEQTPPVFNMQMTIEEETDDLTDQAEQQAREFLRNNPNCQVLIAKLAIPGNLAKEFANPCKQEKRLQTYEFTPNQELEDLYSYVQENYEGGRYRFQMRKGNRNGKVWQITLSDLPGTKPRAEAHQDDDERQEQNLSFIPREPEKPENPLKAAKETMKEHLSFMRDFKEIFGDLMQAQPAAPPPPQPPPTREQYLIEIASQTEDKDIKKRCFDLVLKDETEKPPPPKSGWDFASDILSTFINTPEAFERPVQVLAPHVVPYAMPFIKPIIGGLFNQNPPPANGAPAYQPQQTFLNPPASLTPPPATAAAEQTVTTTGDTGQNNLSRNVTPPRNPRNIPLSEIQETE